VYVGGVHQWHCGFSTETPRGRRPEASQDQKLRQLFKTSTGFAFSYQVAGVGTAQDSMSQQPRPVHWHRLFLWAHGGWEVGSSLGRRAAAPHGFLTLGSTPREKAASRGERALRIENRRAPILRRNNRRFLVLGVEKKRLPRQIGDSARSRRKNVSMPSMGAAFDVEDRKVPGDLDGWEKPSGSTRAEAPSV